MATQWNSDGDRCKTWNQVPGTPNPEGMGLPPPPPYTTVGGLYPTLPSQQPILYNQQLVSGQHVILPIHTHGQFVKMIPTTPPQKDGKATNTSKYATVVTRSSRCMLSPALLVFGGGIAVTVLASRYPVINALCSRPSASVWIGALGVVSAILGATAWRKTPLEASRQNSIYFFLMSICLTLSDGSVVLTASQCVTRASHQLRIMNALAEHESFVSFSHGAKIMFAVVVLESAIAVAAFLHMITAIVASSLLCGLWCSSSRSTPVTVIYIHPETMSSVRRLAAVAPYQQDQSYFVATPATPSAPKPGQFHAT